MQTKNIWFIVFIVLSTFISVQAQTSELFFSEYIEGSSNNKALEIYNGTGAAVDLAVDGYVIQMYFNGSSSAGLTINLAGTLAVGDVYVVAHSSANAAILAVADLTNSSGWYNGDDAVVLRKGGSGGPMIDVIGQIGFDPGAEWGSGLISTQNNTIRKSESSCTGDINGTNAFDPATGWDGFATDTFDGLGLHSANCSEVPVFFSEYIEGTSNNKALEIYNETGIAVDLAAEGYVIQMYFNGSSSAGLTLNLSGTVADGDVHVIAHSSADGAILTVADQTNNAGWYNGDDAVVLRKGGSGGPILDVIGQIGVDPGTEWGVDLTSTQNNTMRRKTTICTGDINGGDAFDPAIEWDGFATNTYDGLGSHSVNCSSGSFDIYTVSTKTGEVERITFIDDADEYNPSFSNNGKHVVHDVVGGTAELSHSLYITDLSTGVSTALTGGEGGNDASWSPNGNYIAFDRVPDGDQNIYTVPAAGGTPTLIRENAVEADWNNNSKRLVFRDITDGSLRTVDLSSGSETVVSAFGVSPSWSANGKAIAFSDGSNIFKVKVNQAGVAQNSPAQVTSDGSGVYNQQPSLSNNGKTITFHSNRVSGDFDIWTIDNKGNFALLSGLADNGDYDPSYSKNGKNVAYAGFTNSVVLASQNAVENGLELSAITSTNPTEFTLEQNYPNPFNPTTVIRFTLPEAASVTLRVYNMSGQLVRTLVSGSLDAGQQSIQWDGNDSNNNKVASGMYLYQITAGSFMQSRKMILMK